MVGESQARLFIGQLCWTLPGSIIASIFLFFPAPGFAQNNNIFFCALGSGQVALDNLFMLDNDPMLPVMHDEGLNDLMKITGRWLDDWRTSATAQLTDWSIKEFSRKMRTDWL